MLQRKLQNVFMINVFVGLLFMVSISLAQSGIWTPKENIPTARLMAASCELNGKIYVIGGGKTLYSSLNTMEVYDPVTNTWDTTKADMPTARMELCVAAVNGKIYAIGGAPSHSGTPLGMVEEYDPLTDTWITKAPMLTPQKQPACGVINDSIYVAGGSAVSNFAPSNKLEVYDPADDIWISKHVMLAARYAPQGAVLNDTFYVSGGLIGSPWTGQKAVQKYDPTTNNWEMGTNFNHGRVGHTTNVIDGKIYAIGGDKQPPVIRDIEEYDPVTEIWTDIGQTPSGIVCHTSSVYDSVIYVFSGNTAGIHQPSTLTNSVYSYGVITSIESQKNLTPDFFVLHQNYPNPFNPRTNIQFSIPKTEYVKLKIFNLLGQEVSTLVSEKLKSGEYQYTWDAGSLASGVYICRLQAGDYIETRKMVLLK